MKQFVAVLACLLPALAADYYVDAAAGSDANPGTSPKAAWKTLSKINTTNFQPGDRILLKSGSVWQEQLAPRTSGTEAAPITIGRYGMGALPRIDAGGKTEDAVRLYNVEHIRVGNLEITNRGDGPAVRRGVHVFVDNFGVAKGVVVSDLYVHDVNGTNEKKDNGGIIFRTNGNQKPSRFDGLTIERNIIWNVDRSAIAAQSYHWPRSKWFPSTNVVIRDNYVEDIGGDGIVPWATYGVLVEHNIARDCNRRADSYNAGIWPWSADNSVFQLNEAAFVRTTKDGQGFDSDYNSRNTLFQYNYSHDNEGGFMLICTPGKRNPQENLGNIGTIVRYNISRNDRARIFNLSAAENTEVHDNAIHVGPGIDVQMLLVSNWSGWPDGAVFRNNSFFVEGTARYGHEAGRSKDGTYSIAPGWGPAKNIKFESNKYYGKHIDAPADAPAAIEPPPNSSHMHWDGPRFDPSKPETFSRFLKEHRAWMLKLFRSQFKTDVRLGR